jgi:integrase/recombinase XerD
MKPLNSYKDNFVAYLTDVRGRSGATSTAYSGDLDRFIAWLSANGIRSYSEVKVVAIEEYLAQLPNSITTKARSRSAISALFSYLLRQEKITANPCQLLESIKLPKREAEYITPQQFGHIMEAARHSPESHRLRDVTILKLLFGTGLRRSELTNLNIDDADLESGRLKVRRKGNKTVWLPLHPEIIKLLTHYLVYQDGGSNQPLFVSRSGSRLSGSQLWRLVKKYGDAAGLSDKLTVHSYRHGHASLLLSQGVDISYISRLLGHSSLGVTLRYVHYRDDQLRSALEQVQF